MWFNPAFIIKSKPLTAATSATTATSQSTNEGDLPKSRKVAKVAHPQESKNWPSDVQVEPWRVKIESMLEGGRKYAVIGGNPADDPVLVSVAIRDMASFQMEVPKASYNPIVLLELVRGFTEEGNGCIINMKQPVRGI
jgi:hypothetical protein